MSTIEIKLPEIALPDLPPGVAIPDTFEELAYEWLGEIEVILFGRVMRRWRGAKKVDLWSWKIRPANPAVVRWEKPIDCIVDGVRAQGRNYFLDDGPVVLHSCDLLILTLYINFFV